MHRSMLKKLFCGFLACVFVITLTPTAFAASDNVVIDYSVFVGTGSPNIFGATHYPSLTPASADADIGDHSSVWPLLTNEMGVRYMRADARLQEILPLTVKEPNTSWSGAQQAYSVVGPDGVERSFSLSGYLEDMENFQKTGEYLNGLANPENWNWTRLDRWVDKASESGFMITVMTFQIPSWLNSTAGSAGAPENWDVYRDIISKLYLHLRGRVDYIELLNEPHRGVSEGGNVTRPDGSPFSGGKNQIAADMFYQAIDAIYETEASATGNPESIPQIKLGGGGDDVWSAGYGVFDTIFSPEYSNYFNRVDFVSIHQYSSRPATTSTSNSSTENGRNFIQWVRQKAGRRVEVFLNEWNRSPQNNISLPEVYGNEAYSFHSELFIDLMLDCWDGAAYYTFYPADVPMDDYEASKGWVESTHGAYFWNNGSPYLRSFYKVWQMYSKQFKLGDGDYKINAIQYQGISDAIGVTNCYGQPVAIVNNYSIFGKSNTTVKMTNLPYDDGTTLTALIYKAGKSDDPSTPSTEQVIVKDRSITIGMGIASYTTAGIILTGAEPKTFTPTQYEFESYDNTFSGEAKILTGNGSNGRTLGYVGNGTENRVDVPVYAEAGDYTMKIHYFCDSAREMVVEVNGQVVHSAAVPSSGGWKSSATLSIDVSLNDGENQVSIYSVNGYAPDLDMLQITHR